MKRIYISGAISGHDDYMERFGGAEKKLKKDGWTVYNPAKVGRAIKEAVPEAPSYDDYMAIDIRLLQKCDAIYMLKGYEYSNGARREYAEAVKLGMKIMYEEELP